MNLSLYIQKTQDSKEIRRTQSVLLIDKEVDYRTIESLTGFKERSVLIFRQRYLKAGLEGLEHKRQGKPKRLLSQPQREEIMKFLELTTPKAHGYESDFWSASVLAHLIHREVCGYLQK